MIVSRPSQDELNALDHPPPAVLDKVNALAPAATAWINSAARDGARGRLLTEAETLFARGRGVLRPEAVRLVVTEALPMPADDALRRQAEALGVGSVFEGGRTMGSVVFLKPRYAGNVEVITHELTHVAQFQRMGTEAMVRRYLTEMLILGYSRSPLEREAYDHQVQSIDNASSLNAGTAPVR